MGEQTKAPIEPLENVGARQNEYETLEKAVVAMELAPIEVTEKTLIAAEAVQEGEEDSQDRVEVHAPDDCFL